MEQRRARLPAALQVIYKIAERCNIDCSYCYYFNMGEETPMGRPARASLKVTDALAKWIAQGCQELRIPRARLSFHGGEPMLIGADAFDKTCRRLREIIEPVAALDLSIQTNGMFVDERWIDRFIEHHVGIGVSIDGVQADNDRFRLDRRGRSTFQKTEQAIRRLVIAHDRGASLPSTISVVHHENDYRSIYRYLRGLGALESSFLLPDRDASDAAFISSGVGAADAACLADIFREWLAEDSPSVSVKFIEQALMHFRRGVAPGSMFNRPRKSSSGRDRAQRRHRRRRRHVHPGSGLVPAHAGLFGRRTHAARVSGRSDLQRNRADQLLAAGWLQQLPLARCLLRRGHREPLFALRRLRPSERLLRRLQGHVSGRLR